MKSEKVLIFALSIIMIHNSIRSADQDLSLITLNNAYRGCYEKPNDLSIQLALFKLEGSLGIKYNPYADIHSRIKDIGVILFGENDVTGEKHFAQRDKINIK